MRYKSGRSLLVALKLQDERQHVIVLDNIGKITAQKLAFIRYLRWEEKFLFIVITESFLPEGELFRLRASLVPCVLIELRNLGVKQAAKFFRYFSSHYHLPWNEKHIMMWARATNGYPLGMKEVVERELERRAEHQNK